MTFGAVRCFSSKAQLSVNGQVSPSAVRFLIWVSVGLWRACSSQEQWALESGCPCHVRCQGEKQKKYQPDNKASFLFQSSFKTGPGLKTQQKAGSEQAITKHSSHSLSLAVFSSMLSQICPCGGAELCLHALQTDKLLNRLISGKKSDPQHCYIDNARVVWIKLLFQ